MDDTDGFKKQRVKTEVILDSKTSQLLLHEHYFLVLEQLIINKKVLRQGFLSKKSEKRMFNCFALKRYFNEN